MGKFLKNYNLSFPVNASEFSFSIVYGSVMIVVIIMVLLCKLSDIVAELSV